MIKVPSLSPGAVKAEKKVELAPMSATTGDRLALGSSPITNQGMSVAVHPPLLRMMRMRMALLVWTAGQRLEGDNVIGVDQSQSRGWVAGNTRGLLAAPGGAV